MSATASIETTDSGYTKGASVIVNAIAVLRSFTVDEPLLGVTEVANRIGAAQEHCFADPRHLRTGTPGGT